MGLLAVIGPSRNDHRGPPRFLRRRASKASHSARSRRISCSPATNWGSEGTVSNNSILRGSADEAGTKPTAADVEHHRGEAAGGTESEPEHMRPIQRDQPCVVRYHAMVRSSPSR